MLFPGTKNTNIELNLGPFTLKSSEHVKLLGVTIDSLCFYPHIQNICSKVLKKTKTILRIRSILSQKQANFLFNSYISSAFRYFPIL